MLTGRSNKSWWAASCIGNPRYENIVFDRGEHNVERPAILDLLIQPVEFCSFSQSTLLIYADKNIVRDEQAREDQKRQWIPARPPRARTCLEINHYRAMPRIVAESKPQLWGYVRAGIMFAYVKNSAC